MEMVVGLVILTSSTGGLWHAPITVVYLMHVGVVLFLICGQVGFVVLLEAKNGFGGVRLWMP